MFGTITNGANAYSKVGLETGVAAASPHKLIVMLFEGAMTAITMAQQHLQAGETMKKGLAISKAISIIESGLRASLDKKVGGEVALNLDALYEYMSSRLLIANLKNDPAVLNEVYDLLKGLKEAWVSIDPNSTRQAASPQPMPKPGAYDALSPQLSSRLIRA